MFAAALCLCVTPVFAQSNGRGDKLDDKSPHSQIVLQRAKNILATLVPDPQSYHLVLSSNSSVGAEAVAPYVFSDKPTLIMYQGTLSPDRANEEVAFIMAHELGHLNLYHNEKMSRQMSEIYGGSPLKISGSTFIVYHQKLQEREADMFGYSLYKKSGYDLKFFPYTLNLMKINPNIHYGTPHVFIKEPSSLSYKNSHFSMIERFDLLTAKSIHDLNDPNSGSIS